MKTFISKLVVLADRLDSLGLKKDADKLDRLIARAARADGDDFGDLMNLFDEPLRLEDSEEDDSPGRSRSMDMPEDVDTLTAIEPDEPTDKKGPSRIQELKRRHELLKLKKQMGLPSRLVPVEEPEDEEETISDEVKLPIATPKDLEGFEDEEDDESDADDGGLLDDLKEKLKGVPDLAKQLLTLVKDNPELLELLAL